jgi:hypothetical protein
MGSGKKIVESVVKKTVLLFVLFSLVFTFPACTKGIDSSPFRKLA